MSQVEITYDLLEELKEKALICEPKFWDCDEHGRVVNSLNKGLLIADANFLEDAKFIAAADPATVLALVARIDFLTIYLFSDMMPPDDPIFRAEELDEEVKTLRVEVERLRAEIKGRAE